MKSIEEVKAKLLKLFAMMENESGACQSEVESAMKSARKLMAQYKLSKEDVLEADKKLEVIQRQFSDITFSTQVNPWIMDLASIIGNNYCCHAVMYHISGAKTRNAGMIGFEEDVEMAANVLKYAVKCALIEGTKIRKDAIRRGYTNADATAMINAYGNGFVRGIREAFEKQNIEEQNTGFAMVMVEPQEVKDYIKDKCGTSSFDTSKANSKARNYDNYAVRGYKEGCNFNTRTKIAG